jgi:hypothetical protein
MAIKHVPGPWEAAHNRYNGCWYIHQDHSERTPIARVIEVNASGEGNARLIAAAPDLLAALLNAHTMIALLNQGSIEDDPIAREALRVEADCRAAIAKATS